MFFLIINDKRGNINLFVTKLLLSDAPETTQTLFWEPFGGPTKNFFVQNVSTHQYQHFLGQKFFSKIKNKKFWKNVAPYCIKIFKSARKTKKFCKKIEHRWFWHQNSLLKTFKPEIVISPSKSNEIKFSYTLDVFIQFQMISLLIEFGFRLKTWKLPNFLFLSQILESLF